MARKSAPAKDTKRKPGWIGTRVTVCGTPIRSEENLICTLPPHHQPEHIHISLATSTNHIHVAIQDDVKELIEWRESPIQISG